MVNNTKVIPGRLFGRKETGGQVELLLLDYAGGLQGFDETQWFECPCLIKASKRPKVGSFLYFDLNLKAEIIGFKDDIHLVRFWFTGHFDQILDQIGQVPLPPYIKRDKTGHGPATIETPIKRCMPKKRALSPHQRQDCTLPRS